MSYPLKYPTPQGANIQIFNAGFLGADNQTWVKPQGASFVWFTLIGAGGGGGGSDGAATGGGGGGSGAVTNCMVPAFLIPDNLQIVVGMGGTGGASSDSDGTGGYQSRILQPFNVQSGSEILLANAGGGGGRSSSSGGGASGGGASASNFFSCMGFYQSIAGQSGANVSSPTTASATTFLSGGAGGANLSGLVQGNYGYLYQNQESTLTGNIFQMQPIIVGLGGSYSTLNDNASAGGTGCGGGGAGGAASNGGNGGNGMVVIITW